jgi:hypothetical protein
MLFLKLTIIAFAHKKSTKKCPKSVHIIFKMAKTLIINYNLSNVFTYLERP